MSPKPIITYQLKFQGGVDVMLRRLPEDTSIADPIKRSKGGALDLIEDRVEVKVSEVDATGQSPERKLTDDEATELETALEQALGHKVAVRPYESI